MRLNYKAINFFSKKRIISDLIHEEVSLKTNSLNSTSLRP